MTYKFAIPFPIMLPSPQSSPKKQQPMDPKEEGEQKTAGSVAKQDRYNAAYMIHFLLGVVDLLPWNAFITAVDYFSYLYPEEHVDKAFSVAYMASSLLVLIALITSTNWSKRPSVRWRINAGLLLFTASLSVPPLMDTASSKKLHGIGSSLRPRPRRDFIATVATVAVCGMADGLVGGSLVGSTGELPKRYMQAVFAGTASSGVLVSVLRIMTKASLPSSGRGLQTSAHLYFTISIIIIVGCSICYNILDKLPVMRYHRNRRIPPSEHNSSSSKDPEASTDLSTSSSTAHPRFWDVWRAIQWSACGVGVLYIVTLSIFPGFITEDVRSLLLKDWYPISLIASYNLFDLAGKTLTAVYVPKGAKWIIWGCFGRLLFYPLFAACLHGPRLFRTEIPVTALTCALGLTNGYLTSVLMILAPKSVPILESEVAGTVMMLFLGIGLAGGSILGWFWVI